MPKRKQIGHKASVGRPNSFIKKSIITLLGIGVLLYPLICFSYYIIHLKDGREIETDKYWEEEDQIKLKQYGGVIGIQKDQVKEIEEAEDVEKRPVLKVKTETPSAEEKADDVKKAEVPEVATKAEASENVVVKEEGTGDKSEVEKATGKEEREKEEKKKDIARYKKEKTVLMEKYRKARQGFREARKAKDKPGIIAAKQQIKDAEKEMAALVRKVKKEAGGLIPPWWFEPEREEQVEVPERR